MPYSKVTSKGQITIPKAVREVLGLEQGDRVAFRIGDDGVVVVEPQTVELLSLRGRLRPRRRGVTADEMETVIRKGARGR